MRKRSIPAAIFGYPGRGRLRLRPSRRARSSPSIELTDLAGQTVPLKNVLGTATVLNFWATWCGPCRMEMPELQKLSNEFGGKGFVVLAVNVDLPPRSDDVGVAGQLAADQAADRASS